MKAYWGSGGIAPRILDLGTRWSWVVSFTPRSLYPQGKRPWYPLGRSLDGHQSRFGCGGKEKKSPAHARTRTSDIQSRHYGLIKTLTLEVGDSKVLPMAISLYFRSSLRIFRLLNTLPNLTQKKRVMGRARKAYFLLHRIQVLKKLGSLVSYLDNVT
jgi:hypothetical protein